MKNIGTTDALNKITDIIYRNLDKSKRYCRLKLPIKPYCCRPDRITLSRLKKIKKNMKEWK